MVIFIVFTLVVLHIEKPETAQFIVETAIQVAPLLAM